MTSIVRAKPPVLKKYESNRKFHTLHCTKQHVFTIQKNGTSIVAFRKKTDSITFAKLLESHFDITMTWPHIDFEESVMFRSPESFRLKYLNIITWREEELRTFCIKNSFNLLDIYRIEDNYRLVGRSIIWEAPIDMYVSMLNDKFMEE